MRSIARLKPSREPGRWILLDDLGGAYNGGVYTFVFATDFDGSSTGDNWVVGTLEELEADNPDEIEGDWMRIGASLPDCVLDWVWPVRVASDEAGEPRYGELERLVNGEWLAFDPEVDTVPTVEDAIREAIALTKRER